jgi:hypothetical protein
MADGGHMYEQEEMISSSIDPFHQIFKLNLLNDFELF